MWKAHTGWCPTPTSQSDPDAVQRLRTLIVGLGAAPLLLDPERHDDLIAGVSHLPMLWRRVRCARWRVTRIVPIACGSRRADSAIPVVPRREIRAWCATSA